MRLAPHGPGGPRDPETVLANDVGLLDAARPGETVVARAWKYNGQAHYVVPGRYLGADEHGHWVHQPSGSFVSRPGLAFHASRPALLLVPRDEHWVVTFHPRDEESGVDWFIYADISARITAGEFTVPTITPGARTRAFEVESFDMDLDVVNSRTRGVFIDDEDEFLEHASLFDYPEPIRAAMREAAETLSARFSAGVAPFDDPSSTVDHWWSFALALETP